MSKNTIGLGVAGVGAALFLFAVTMWAVNKPDFYSGIHNNCRIDGQPGTSRYNECAARLNGYGDEASASYRICLFSTRYEVCRAIAGVPYLSIAGIMIALAGGGVLLFGRKTRTV